MRNFLLTSALVGGLFAGVIALPGSHGATHFMTAAVNAMALDTQTPDQPPPTQQPQQPTAPQQQPQQPAPQVNVEVHRDVQVWYTNPVWMAMGGLTLLVIIAFVVMAARGGGGGTTIVRG